MLSRPAIVTAIAIGTALLLAGCGTSEDPVSSSATPHDAAVDPPRPVVPDPPDGLDAGAVFDDPGNDGVACPDGLTRCGDACQDLMESGGNCGACGAHCPVSMHCRRGQCVYDR